MGLEERNNLHLYLNQLVHASFEIGRIAEKHDELLNSGESHEHIIDYCKCELAKKYFALCGDQMNIRHDIFNIVEKGV